MLGMSEREVDDFKRQIIGELGDPDRLQRDDWDLSISRPGERSLIAQYVPTRPLALMPTQIDLAVFARAIYTADGAAPETFALSEGLVRSGATSENLVVYKNGARVQPASVDYDADSFDLDTAADDSVTAFYAADSQARIEIEKIAPNGTSRVIFDDDLRRVHLRDHEEDPLELDLDGFFEPIVPVDYELNVYVDAPYEATLAHDADGDGDLSLLPSTLLEMDIRRGTSSIDGLDRVVRMMASQV